MQNPNTASAHHALALDYTEQKLSDKALAHFIKAALLAPNEPLYQLHLANALAKKDPEKALEHYLKALELKPDYPEAHVNIANLYRQFNQAQKALHHYHEALVLAPDFTNAHFNLGLLFLSQQQLEAAKTQFSNVLSLSSYHESALFYLGIIALTANELDSAQEHFSTILAHNNEHIEALVNLGVIALKKQQKQEAIEYFASALALNNDHIEARHNLASTFMHFDRFENALIHYRELLAKDPNNIEYLYNMGVAEMGLGHLSEATDYFNKLLSINPEHAAALNNQAAILMKQGDKPKAMTMLQRTLAVNPDDKVSQYLFNALSHQASDTCPDYAKNLFNNYALFYDKHLQETLHYTLPQQLFNLLKEAGIKNLQSTLDLGAGTGLTGAMIRPYTKELIGVDIAEKMLQEARAKNIYDALITQELIEFLQQDTKLYDRIIAADVLPYFGDLEPLWELISQHLVPNGQFIFSVEMSDEEDWCLQNTARFAHKRAYLKKLSATYHLAWTLDKECIGRHQDKEGLPMLLGLLTKL